MDLTKNQGVSRAVLPLAALGEHPILAFSGFLRLPTFPVESPLARLHPALHTTPPPPHPGSRTATSREEFPSQADSGPFPFWTAPEPEPASTGRYADHPWAAFPQGGEKPSHTLSSATKLGN